MAAINFLYRSTRDTSELNLRLLYRFEDEDYVFGTKTKIVISKSDWTDIKSGKKITDANLKKGVGFIETVFFFEAGRDIYI